MRRNQLVFRYFMKTFTMLFLAVVVPMVIMSGFFVNSIYTTAREEQFSVYTDGLNNDKNRISEAAIRIKSYLLLLNASNELEDVQHNSYEGSLFSYAQLMDNLTLYYRNHDEIKNVSIYVGNSEKIVSSDGGIYNLGVFSEQTFVIEFITNGSRSQYFSKDGRIFYFTVMPKWDYDDSVVMMFEVDPVSVFQIDEDDSLILANNYGKVLYHSQAQSTTDNLEDMNFDSVDDIYSVEQDDSILVYGYEADSGLIIVRKFDRKALSAVLNSSILYTGIIVFALFILSVISSYMVTRLQVKPIVKLSEGLQIEPTNLESDDEKRISIFDSIEASLNIIKEENEDYLHRYDENKSIVKEQLIRELLFGRVGAFQSVDEYLRSYDISSNENFSDYSIILFSIGGNIPSTAPIEASKIAVVAKSIIEKKLMDNLNVIGSAAIELSQVVFLIGNISSMSYYDGEEHIKKVITELYGILNQTIKIKVHSTVSFPVTEVKDLCKVFMRLKRFKSSDELAKDPIVFLRKTEGQMDDYSSFHQTELVQYVLAGDIVKVKGSLDEILILKDRIFNDDMKSNYPLMIMNNVASMLMESSEDLEAECAKIVSFIYHPTINAHDKYNKISTLIIEMTTKCKEHSLKKDNNAHVYNAIEFINSHYQAEIDVRQISDYIGINTSYFSRIFKSNLDMTPLQYITMIRINKAKEMLVETNKTIKDISTDVGYPDSRSFIRFFKKIEGCTPGEYRKKLL